MSELIVCPFCPLHCDDLIVDGVGGAVEACDVARQGVEAFRWEGRIRLGDSAGTFCVSDVAASLQLSESPVVEAGWLSIEQAKRLQVLSERITIKSRPARGAIADSVARDGTVTATLGDVLHRADVVWLIGNFQTSCPRLAAQVETCGATILSTEQLSLDRLAALQSNENSANPHSDVSAEDSLYQTLAKSNYLAILLGQDAFAEHCELVGFESLNRFVSLRNERSIDSESRQFYRAVVLSLTPHQNLETVFRWSSNCGPQRSAVPGISKGYSTEIRLGNSTTGPTTVEKVPLQIGGTDPGPDGADAYLPAAQAGIHLPGTTLRGDGAVTLPLSAPVATDRCDPIALLEQVLDESAVK